MKCRVRYLGTGGDGIKGSFIFHTPQQILIICVIKQRRLRWARHVPHMGDRRIACRVSVG
jgi:hypothetical protein